MGCPYTIYIAAFHQHYLFCHLFSTDDVSCLRVRFMPVYAFQFDWLPIDTKEVAAAVIFVHIFCKGNNAGFSYAQIG